MNKKWTLLPLALSLYGSNTFADNSFFNNKITLLDNKNWTGFYLGGKAGFAWTSNNITNNATTSTQANPIFLPNSQVIATSLAILGIHDVFNSASGFTGGGQIGYNDEFIDGLVIGIDTEFSGIQLSSATEVHKIQSAFPLGSYNADIILNKKLDYLGFIKGRLGALVSRSLLVYGTGAFAYGGGSIESHYSLTSTQPLFSPLSANSNEHKMLAGWGVGGGAEWIFLSHWSLYAEYVFYDLGPIQSHTELNQNLNTTPPTFFAGATTESEVRFTGNTARVGVNYRFS